MTPLKRICFTDEACRNRGVPTWIAEIVVDLGVDPVTGNMCVGLVGARPSALDAPPQTHCMPEMGEGSPPFPSLPQSLR